MTAGSGQTTYVLLIGPSTIWDDLLPCSLGEVANKDQTILLTEIATSKTFWLELRDMTVDEIAIHFLYEEKYVDTNHPGVVVVACADGNTEIIGDSEEEYSTP